MGRKRVTTGSKYEGLNIKQALIFDYIKNYYDTHHYPPTVREIGDALNISSTSTVYNQLENLRRAGYISKANNRMRAIEILKDGNEVPKKEVSMAPIIGKIAAGTPIMATENIMDYYPLPLDYFPAQNSLFILKIEGDSMKDAGILNGDFVILEKRDFAENGEIIAALINHEEATVKRYYKEEKRIRLQPENADMQPMYFDDVKVIGKVIGLFRKF